MKINLPVTQKESPYPKGTNLISTTDLKGIVTSANKAFCDIAGFTEEELVGKNHNKVRHPDMPVEAFADLWATNKEKKPWMGLVKNRCKNGDHYYVDAYVTPIFEGDSVVGYQSVRREPSRVSINQAEKLYRDLREKRSKSWTKLYPGNISNMVKPWITSFLAASPVLIAGIPSANLVLFALAASTFLIGGTFGFLQMRPLGILTKKAAEIANSPLTQKIYTDRADEFGLIELALHAQDSKLNTILCRIDQAGDVMKSVVEESLKIVELTSQGTGRQQEELEQLATALNEMTATVSEVARIAENTSRSSNDVTKQANQGLGLVQESISDIRALASDIDTSTNIIEKLQNDCDSIGSVIEVISKIASQTNLLALNAAIEAARAGEQGRGFAVVADEVRNLASNTQESTEQIREVIVSLQDSAGKAVTSMESAQSSSENSVNQSEKLGQAFDEINTAIQGITSMNEQVATAAEEQTVATEEISRNVTSISDVANTTRENSDRTGEISLNLEQQVENMRVLVKQFSRG